MSTIVLSDIGRVRSEQEWQNVALLESVALTKATHEAYTSAVFEIGDWEKLQVILDISAVAAADAGDTLDVSVDMSMDNLAWYNVGGFTQMLGNGSTAREIMTFVPGTLPTDPNALIIGSTDAGATVVREHLVGRYARIRTAIVDAGTNASWTSSITAMVWRNDIVRQEVDEIKEIELYPLAVYTNEDVPAASDIWEIGDSWDWIQVVLRTTNHDTDAGDKLDVMIDLSVDGVDFYNVAQFTQCDGDNGPWVELFTLVPGLADNIDAILDVTADAGETVSRPGFAGPFLRARAVITESGTDDEAFTFSLFAYVK